MVADKLKELTESVAKKAFPNETWIEVSSCVFVASCRYKALGGFISKNEQEKLEKEIEQARNLVANGHVVFLTPEVGRGKHFDGFMDGNHTFDLKRIKGSINKVGSNFKDGAKKSEIVFLEIIKDFSRREIYRKLRGELKDMQRNNVEIKVKHILIKIKDSEIYTLETDELI